MSRRLRTSPTRRPLRRARRRCKSARRLFCRRKRVRLIDHQRTAVNARPNIGLHRLALLLSCMTIVLLGAGALVTSNEAGDSVPDWPLSFGRWLISSNHFVANVRFEYSHRVIAGVVGLTTLLVAL